MTSKYEEIDLERVRTVPIAERGSKVTLDQFGTPIKGGKTFKHWLGELPDQLAADRLRELTLALRRAKGAKGRELIWIVPLFHRDDEEGVCDDTGRKRRGRHS